MVTVYYELLLTDVDAITAEVEATVVVGTTGITVEAELLESEGELFKRPRRSSRAAAVRLKSFVVCDGEKVSAL